MPEEDFCTGVLGGNRGYKKEYAVYQQVQCSRARQQCSGGWNTAAVTWETIILEMGFLSAHKSIKCTFHSSLSSLSFGF